ncbi:aarF domain-containing kinase [Nematocida sp. AWRm80]|nr:aarF domain-containing kinase [Nematocida sp. AWRm80]
MDALWHPFAKSQYEFSGPNNHMMNRAIDRIKRGNRKETGYMAEYLRSGVKISKFLAVDIPIGVIACSISSRIGSRLIFNAFTRNGPVIMKLGQFLSTRTDILPKNVIYSLRTIQSAAPIQEVKNPLAVLLKETGIRLPENSLVSQVGSGCIAQVFKIRYQNKEYAMKIIAPETKRTILADLTVLHYAFKAIGLGTFYQQFRRIMTEQIDLRNEKNNMTVFRKNFKWYRSTLEDSSLLNRILSHFRMHQYIFPKPILATENILLSDFWAGTQVKSSDTQGILLLGMKMVFKDRFVHADLHPGNLAVIHSQTTYPNIVVYDTGLVHTITQRERDNLVDLFKELLLGHKRHALELLVDRHPENKQTPMEKEAFVTETISSWNAPLPRAYSPVQRLIHLYLITKKHKVILDDCYTNLFISFAYTHSLLSQCTCSIRWPKLFMYSNLLVPYLELFLRSILKKY